MERTSCFFVSGTSYICDGLVAYFMTYIPNEQSTLALDLILTQLESFRPTSVSMRLFGELMIAALFEICLLAKLPVVYVALRLRVRDVVVRATVSLVSVSYEVLAGLSIARRDAGRG